MSETGLSEYDNQLRSQQQQAPPQQSTFTAPTVQPTLQKKILIKRKNKQERKLLMPGQPSLGDASIRGQPNPENIMGGPQNQAAQFHNTEERNFYEQQAKETIEQEKKDLEQRFKEAEQNQLTKAQKDIKDDRCDFCGKTNCLVLKIHEGTMVCTNCGIVAQSSMIDQTNEKRVFSSDLAGADQSSNRIQARGNSFMPQQETIVISGNNKEAKALQNYSMNKFDGTERNLAEGKTKINLLAESLNLNHADVKYQAFAYLKQIEHEKILKGKSLEAKVGCVMFYAARNTRKNRKVDQILNYVNSTQREMNKCFKKCKEVLKFVPIPPAHIVESVSQKLSFSPDIMRAAQITANNFSKYALCEGKRPHTIAGVSLFMVLQFSKKHKEDTMQHLLDKISKQVDISNQTIKETYQNVFKQRDKLLPDYIYNKSRTSMGANPSAAGGSIGASMAAAHNIGGQPSNSNWSIPDQRSWQQ